MTLKERFKRLIDSARTEWQDTLKSKQDALGRSLVGELTYEALTIGRLIVELLWAVYAKDTDRLAKLLQGDKEMTKEELLVLVVPIVKKAAEKGIKRAVQAAVSIGAALAIRGGGTADPATEAAITAVVFGLLEAVRTSVKALLLKKGLVTLAAVL